MYLIGDTKNAITPSITMLIKSLKKSNNCDRKIIPNSQAYIIIGLESTNNN